MTRWARHATAVAMGVLVVGALSAGALPALAAPAAPSARTVSAPSNGSFAIGPTPRPGSTQSAGYFTVNAIPGQKFVESVSVANYTRARLKLWLYAADAYTIRDGGGFAVRGLHAAPRDVGAWVSRLPRSVTIPARRQVNIRFAIRVPRNATPGTHAGGIVAQTVVPQIIKVNNKLRVKAYRQVFTRIYATVIGRLTPDFEVDSLLATHPQPPFPLITHRDGVIRYYVSNTGNAVIAPTAHLWVSGIFGTSMDKTIPAASQILPGNLAAYSLAWHGVPAIGPVHIHLSVHSAYGLTRTAEYSYWAMPVPFLAVVVVVIAAAVAAWILLRRRRRGRSAAA